ncbi:uncharacterized protein LOC108664413 [Hyalella azteca]|uniref:Uncharacterized protein LOC108664413 n=1 Tax=Hyalella azteca TaxID=294128 RepID=A0A8B7MYY6_HYAAZ|nr:uncharacterized protein LOC108664413 [Hyalella azteca]XP_047735512.1 uncharacterized protein LOC108664413 [Hyalella azteca]XP_047735513.1 uncharacterized protein LOC108664413 [Hyalella azteca]
MAEDDGADVQLGAAAEATVMAYHELALDADKRLHLALDETCLQFLSLVIGNGDNNLASKSMATLAALAESPECRAPMASTFGVLHSLRASVEEDNDHTDEMKSKAAELFTCLNFALYQQRAARRRSKMPSEVSADPPSSVSVETNSCDSHMDSSKVDAGPSGSVESCDSRIESSELEAGKVDTDDVDGKNDGKANKKGSRKAVTGKETQTADPKYDKDNNRGLVRSESAESTCSSVSMSSSSQPCQKLQTPGTEEADGQSNSRRGKYYTDPKFRTRLITLHVQGMQTPSERACVEGALVRVRGVISLVFDMTQSRIACRVRRVLDLAKLGSAIDKLDMNMQLFQVVAKNVNEEVRIPLSKAPVKSTEEAKKASSPSRDDDDTSDVELPEYLPEDEDDECAAVDDPSSAVANTGAAIREAASSLFSAAASLLQQSFYW